MTFNLENRTIFCKDNLDILKGINSNCINLIYLDPPFNKKKIFTAPIGSSAEGASFRDIFSEADIKDEWVQTIKEDYDKVHNFLLGIKNIEGEGSYNYCYLCYMAIRLIECHRVLTDTGSIYLHCDSTMSHYLKLLLDYIFGEKNLRNEIIWCYHGPGSPKMKQFNRKTDHIFWYTKSKKWVFNANDIRIPFKDSQQTLRKAMSVDGTFSKADVENYRKKGKVPENWWEIRIAARSKKEYVGYPTQKPLKLLERIIKASSNGNDIVLDPFCGCATTCIAAEKLGRQWIGIDVSIEAYELVKKRLKKEVANPENLLEYNKKLHFSTTPPKRTDTDEHYVEKKYVYVVSNTKYKGEYKVDIAKNYHARLNFYQTSDPDREYKLEFYLLTEKYREIEQHIHNKFQKKHEWVQGDLKKITNEIKSYNKRN